MVIAPGHVQSGASAITQRSCCIAVGGGAAGALNMWYEARYRRRDVAHR
jgi:heme O synthase-like polyprenyltransferase